MQCAQEVCEATPLPNLKGAHTHMCEVWFVCLWQQFERQRARKHLKIRRGDELQSCAEVCETRLAEMCFQCMTVLWLAFCAWGVFLCRV